MLRLVFSSRKDKPYRPVFGENCFAEQSFVRGTLPERKSSWAKNREKTSRTDQFSKKTALRSKVSRGVPCPNESPAGRKTGKRQAVPTSFRRKLLCEAKFREGYLARTKVQLGEKQGKDKPYRPVFEENCFAKQSFVRGKRKEGATAPSFLVCRTPGCIRLPRNLGSG